MQKVQIITASFTNIVYILLLPLLSSQGFPYLFIYLFFFAIIYQTVHHRDSCLNFLNNFTYANFIPGDC
jgi:hypothetical protein